MRLADFLQHPEFISQTPPAAVPDLLAELEALRALLWARLVTVQGPPATLHPEQEPNRLLTVAQVAEVLSVRKSHAYELIRRNEIPAIRLGRYVRVRLSDLRRWVVNHQV